MITCVQCERTSACEALPLPCDYSHKVQSSLRASAAAASPWPPAPDLRDQGEHTVLLATLATSAALGDLMNGTTAITAGTLGGPLEPCLGMKGLCSPPPPSTSSFVSRSASTRYEVGGLLLPLSLQRLYNIDLLI